MNGDHDQHPAGSSVPGTRHPTAASALDGGILSPGDLSDPYSSYAGGQWTNQDVVEKAFEDCDLNGEGRLTYEAFKMWVTRNPAIMDYLESILPYAGPKPSSVAAAADGHHDRDGTTCCHQCDVHALPTIALL